MRNRTTRIWILCWLLFVAAMGLILTIEAAQSRPDLPRLTRGDVKKLVLFYKGTDPKTGLHIFQISRPTFILAEAIAAYPAKGEALICDIKAVETTRPDGLRGWENRISCSGGHTFISRAILIDE